MINRIIGVIILMTSIIGGIALFKGASNEGKNFIFYSTFILYNVLIIHLNYKIIKIERKLNKDD